MKLKKHDDFCPCTRFRAQEEFCTCANRKALTPEELKRIGNHAWVSNAAGPDVLWPGNLLPQELWEDLRTELQRRYRRSTGENMAVLTIENAPTPQPKKLGNRWRVIEAATAPGYWGIELEDAGNDDDAILYPQKIHRDTVARIVEAHNAAITTVVRDDDPYPGEHREVLDAIASHNSGEEE